MKLLRKVGLIEIWQVSEAYGDDFYVYGVTESGDPIVCPSFGMACEKAGV